MDQGVIATYYLRRTFIQLVKDTDGEAVVKEASDNIGNAWAEIKQSCMKGVSKKCQSEFSDSHDFDLEQELSNSGCDIVDMARSVGFMDVDQANVDKLLQFHTTELTNEDLLKIMK